MTHYESVSRGLSGFYQDYQEFLRRWTEVLQREDPFYNPNLSRLEHWCSLRPPDEDEKWLELPGGWSRARNTPRDERWAAAPRSGFTKT